MSDSCQCRCNKSIGKKINASLYSSILFFVLAHPETFRFVRQSLVGSQLVANGTNQLLLHTAIFFISVFVLMSLPKN